MRSLILFALLSIVSPAIAQQPAPSPATVDVILWFDTEDYILPASDDAALRLATWLTEQHIQATFKVVGEKARTLERRGRTDVIAALKKHEIGYHSNWHSVPPTPAQYLNACGWADGVAEFTRREKPGFDDVARIFGQKPSCYGQPGSSWASQSHAALHQWGMRIYLDAGNHINVEGKPFWYGGLLNFYKLNHQIRVGINYPNELEEAKIKFLQARDQLISEGGGVISIVYHPCEFVHQQFWDGVNFKNGANPPREAWKLPPTKTEAQSKLAYYNFEQYVLFMQRFPGVHFVTATQAAKAYPDLAMKHNWTYLDIERIAIEASANFHKEGIHWVRYQNMILSPAEFFWLATLAVTKPIDFEKATTLEVIVGEALPTLIQGPGRAPARCEKWSDIKLTQEELHRTAAEVKKYLLYHEQIPPEVWVGSKAITPEAYLLAVINLLEQRYVTRHGKQAPEHPHDKEPVIFTAKFVADDSPNLWRWVIFPFGFQAPNVMAEAKRQSWNLKPALRVNR